MMLVAKVRAVFIWSYISDYRAMKISDQEIV